ncbi:MAG TPA: helix-hairpin-helix domain-containing protein [Myxococcaceae bacterium]|nr:helix-hairpin-helix domain-containing protein [Myxococcaceae bacterium]
MRQPRTPALALGVAGGLALGWWLQGRWPDSAPALACPRGLVRWTGEGPSAHARCGGGREPPAPVRAALGLRLPLNRVDEADLARLPGVGPLAARALVQARPFRSWDEVDAVKGVGPARLRTLRQATELDP